MNVETWFDVIGHGYNVPRDGFGFEGVKLTPRAGETLVIKVNRKLPAKRLGRLTGGGLFAESQKLGLETDWTESGILGCDSVQNAVHDGKMFWSWGDTTLPGYPLGLYQMLGTTTEVQPIDRFEPPVRLRFNYFTDAKNKPRNIAQIPGDGPTWLSGFASLPDATGKKHLVATYSKIKPPLETYELGLCVWNERTRVFEPHRVVWRKTDETQPVACPLGHAVEWKDDAGRSWLLFGDPFPSLKIAATYESWSSPESWQELTPQVTVPIKVDSSLGSQIEEQVKPHRGAIAWNAFRKKWITVFTQFGGRSSEFGELWYAEAEQPTGPWANAIHIVTHSKYTFYNPQLHPEFTQPNSPIVLFEATYTKEFSGNERATPRYDYNQVLYRLDLDELK